MNAPMMLEQHQPLVRRIAEHLMARLPSSVDIDDLIQAGMMGLMDAAASFDANAGAAFETYAGIRIRGAMLDELRSLDWAPRSLHRKVRAASEAMRKLEQRYGHAAREVDVAAEIGMNIDDYRQMLADSVQCQMTSLHSEDDEDSPAQQVADHSSPNPFEMVDRRQFQASLAAAIRKLPAKEQQVLSLYYQQELTLREIGEVLSVTESRVCQLHGQALTRIRSQLGDWVGSDAAKMAQKALPDLRLARG